MLKRSLFATATVALVTLAGNLNAKPALKDVAEVRDGIIAVGMAYEISQQCDGIGARTLRGLLYLNDLKSRARALGYSNAEIDAYIADDAEKRRLEAVARAQLAAKGAEPGDPASHCAVGRAEMARGTVVGSLLR